MHDSKRMLRDIFAALLGSKDYLCSGFPCGPTCCGDYVVVAAVRAIHRWHGWGGWLSAFVLL